MQGIEIRHTINAQNDRLAVDHKMALSVLQRGFDDPWIALRPVVAVPGKQPHPIAVAFQTQPIAVVFDFVEPIRGMRNLGSPCRNAKIERLTPQNRNFAAKRESVSLKPNSTEPVGLAYRVALPAHGATCARPAARR
jgi:hypothetical protein